jgi:hypothetical protein
MSSEVSNDSSGSIFEHQTRHGHHGVDTFSRSCVNVVHVVRASARRCGAKVASMRRDKNFSKLLLWSTLALALKKRLDCLKMLARSILALDSGFLDQTSNYHWGPQIY